MNDSIIKKLMKISENNYNKYNEELEKIIKMNNEYPNLTKIFESFKQKKIYYLSFLFFSQYKNLIFPYINNIQNESEKIYTFNKLNTNNSVTLDNNLFILWYFYLFRELYDKNKNYPEKNNQIRYLLSETNQAVSLLYNKDNLSINNIIDILDFYLLSLKINEQNPDFIELMPDIQKIKKIVIFENFFNLLRKISIISVKNEKIEDFGLILEFLGKLNDNSELNNEADINLLLSNNIIQDFMNDLLQNINFVTIANILPLYKEKLINFYSHFLAYKYKISNLFSNIMDILRHSFEHLYYFINNKDLILKDISLNNFNSFLIKKLFEIEQEITKNETVYPLDSSFLFDQKNSQISFSNKKMKLDKIVLFFSFQIGNNNSNDRYNEEFPLILIKRINKNKDYEVFLKVFLKKITPKKEKESTKYNLCISQSIESNVIEVIDLPVDHYIIDEYNTYYCALYLNNKTLSLYLYYEILKKNNNVLIKQRDFIPMKKEEEVSFIIGNNENYSFFKGKIGPIIMINAPDVGKKIDKKISEILTLKDNYKDFLIIKSESAKKIYNFDLIEYFEQKTIIDINEKDEKKSSKKKESDKEFSCLLYLDPNSFNYLKNEEIINENEKKELPIFSKFSENNKNFEIIKVNVSLSNFKNIKNLFMMDNGLNYICLQIEYYSQFLKY